jgi:uncharacterized protein YbaP (TraB family)
MRRLMSIVLAVMLWPSAAAAECGGIDLMARLAADNPAAHTALMQRAHATTNPQGKFWRVRRGTAPPSHLFGTFHDTAIARRPLDPDVAAALTSARLLLVEVTEEEQARMRAQIERDPDFVIDRAGTGLSRKLTPQQRAAVEQALRAQRNMTLATVDSLHPWMLLALLATPECMQREMRAGQPVLDNLLIAEAKTAGIPVAGLETYLQGPASIAAVPPAILNRILVETLLSLGDEEDGLRTAASLYQSGEIAAIWEFSIHTAAETLGETESREIFAAFGATVNEGRNRAWMAVLEPELARGGVFAAFGALHLPGDNGVIELLRARGFEVTRLDG